MNTSSEELKVKIIERINTLSTDKLKNVDEFINQLEVETDHTQKTLSFAGAWKDMDEELFKDLTDKLHTNRQEGEDRIS